MMALLDPRAGIIHFSLRMMMRHVVIVYETYLN